MVIETLLVIAVLIVIAWAVVRARRRASEGERATSALRTPMRVEIETAVHRDYAPAGLAGDMRKVKPKKSKDHVPPSPLGHAVEAWSPRTQQVEVAGEWYRAESLRTLFLRHATVSDLGAEIRLDAVLVPDPTNPFDRHAVAVFVDGLHVGYMERSDAAAYHDAIARLPGGELRVLSRQWLRGTAQDTWARVTLSLPKPQHLSCPNPAEPGSVILSSGSTVQVTREEEHMQHLTTLLARFGSETVVAASLRSTIDQRPRSTPEVVAVDIDSRQVGVLSPTQTANFLPLVRRAESEGRRLLCRASLRGNSLKADVALHARKAHEFDDAELERLFAT